MLCAPMAEGSISAACWRVGTRHQIAVRSHARDSSLTLDNKTTISLAEISTHPHGNVDNWEGMSVGWPWAFKALDSRLRTVVLLLLPGLGSAAMFLGRGSTLV